MSAAKPIYLDYQATTPMDDRVLQVMMRYLTADFGNPHSATHSYGWTGEAAVDTAREQVADVIGAAPSDIIFTSGATESNNLAIKGLMQIWGAKKPHIISCVTEHKCVLESIEATRAWGCEVTYIGVDEEGRINLHTLQEALRPDTALVSVMAVNNEIGTIQLLKEIGMLVRENGSVFHCDAAQAFGKIPLDVEDMYIDLMSISAHKAYGPKGIGALFRRNERRCALAPHMSGGGQEGGLRSGTQAPALAAGFGKAAELAVQEMQQDQDHVAGLYAYLHDALLNSIPGAYVNGPQTADARWLGNMNVTIPQVDGDMLLAETRGIAYSSGAACASAVTGPSYVLKAIGLDAAAVKSSIRLGFGRFTTVEDVEQAADILISAVSRIRG